MKYLLYFLLVLMTSQASGQTHKYVVGELIDSCGIVFYVQSGLAQGQRILVCAVKDQDPPVRWFNGQYSTTSANKDGLFGKANALRVIAVQKDFLYAANLTKLPLPPPAFCRDTSAWYLPSRAELKIMYDSLAVKRKFKFAKAGYWSSVEQLPADSSFNRPPVRKAWIVDFLNGRPILNDKANKYHVRAVKEFFAF